MSSNPWLSPTFAAQPTPSYRGLRIQRIPGLRRVTSDEARAVEQVLIELHGLAKNGGTLLNKINSIAKTNPKYANALKLGAKLLRKAGYLP